MRCRQSVLRTNISMMISAHIYLKMTLLEVQCDTYPKIIDIRKFRRRSEAAVKKEAAVATLITRRVSGELSRINFVNRVSFKFLPPSLKK